MHSKQLEEEDPDLAAAIRASLAEVQPQASTSAAASAPPKTSYAYTPAVQPSVPSYELAMSEFDALDSFSNALRNPHIRSEDANELFTRADRHRGKMYRALEDAHAKSSMLAELNHKLQHAVRLYDSLLERNISRYSQPYQQAQAQQYYQPQQSQQQHYQNGLAYQPHQMHDTQTMHQPAYAQPQQQYAQAQHGPPQQSYSGPPAAEHASPPGLQQNSSYQGQAQAYAGQAPGEYSSNHTNAPERYQQPQYASQAPGSPPQQYAQPLHAGHAAQAAGPTNPDEQYYNPYPAEVSGDGPQVYHQNGAQLQGYDAQQDASAPYAASSPYPASQQLHQPPGPEQSAERYYAQQQQHEGSAQQQQDPTQANFTEGQAVHAHAVPAAGQEQPPQAKMENGRFQGFYSAASFPAVPSMPVGGFPTAPKGEVFHHEERVKEPEQKKEEALIEF